MCTYNREEKNLSLLTCIITLVKFANYTKKHTILDINILVIYFLLYNKYFTSEPHSLISALADRKTTRGKERARQCRALNTIIKAINSSISNSGAGQAPYLVHPQ